MIADAKSINNFSGTGYFFAQDLQRSQEQPVGLIESAVGGTPIESWMSAESIAEKNNLAFIQQDWNEVLAKYPAQMADYKLKFSDWYAHLNPSEQMAVDAGKIPSGAPALPLGTGSKAEPSGLYNGTIAPITPYTIRGVVWYQGESNYRNAREAYFYRNMFATMIEDWRKRWGEGDIPFYFMQLSRYHFDLYPLLRESQMKALKLKNTGMVVTADLGMVTDVHYADKKTVGVRLSHEIQKDVYSRGNSVPSPLPRMLTEEDGALCVWFDNAGSGMKISAAPLQVFGPLTDTTPPESTADGKSIRFEAPLPEAVERAVMVGGADGIFYPAILKAEGTSVLASSPKVPAPTQKCYAWDGGMPALVLWNSAPLPAPPFRIALDPLIEPRCPGGVSSGAGK